MAAISVKIDSDIYKQVIEHTQKNGSKIGKFFELAATEKLQREGIPTLDRQELTNITDKFGISDIQLGQEWPIKKETKWMFIQPLEKR